MPTGIILTSASPGATQADVEKVLSRNGLEVDKPEPDSKSVEADAEPKRDAFESDEDFAIAHEEWKAAQPAEEYEEEDPEVVSAKKPSKFQKRINKITASLKQEIADLKKQLEGKAPVEKKEEPQSKRPARKDFADDQQYEDALLAWGIEKENKAKAAKDTEQAQRAQLEANLTNYRAQVEEFKEAHDDWDEVVNQDIPMHTSVQLAVMEQENGAEVIYYLGRHPEYAKKLAEMSPLSAVMEVGRLSAKLKAGSGSPGSGTGRGEQPKPKPKVPAPVQPVSTAAVSSTLTSRDAAKNRDFRAFKAAQRAGR